MEVLSIPFDPSIPHSRQQTEIAGSTYTFEFEILEKSGNWLLHLYDSEEKPLVMGLKLVPDWPLLRRDAGVMGAELVYATSGELLAVSPKR